MFEFVASVAPFLAVVIACQVVSAASSSVHHFVRKGERGGKKYLPPKTECVLYLKQIQWEDGHDTRSWHCEFPLGQAAEYTGGNEMVEIKGISSKEIERMGPVSGESLMIVDEKTYISEIDTTDNGSYENENGSYNRSADQATTLYIPPKSDYKIESMDWEIDTRHARNRRARRQRQRNLASSEIRILDTLVIRVIDGEKVGPAADAKQLTNDVFTGEFCLKSQYAACSHDQVIVNPVQEHGTTIDGLYYPGIVNVGVSNVATQGNNPNIEAEATVITTTMFGGGDSLGNLFDIVMFCLPGGTGNWVAYAYINDWRSYYNDFWCQRVSTQMHEVGHNLNLGHSGLPGNSEYADTSGMMGYSHDELNGPKQCFNPAKSYQLGWYSSQVKSIDPLDLLIGRDSPLQYTLNGVADYAKDGSNGDALVSLRLENDGLLGGLDYYIGYNRAVGANVGTKDVPNLVTIHAKENSQNDSYGRDGHGKSIRLARLRSGSSYVLENFKGTNFDITVTAKSINGKDAIVEISTVSNVQPTAAPSKMYCDGGKTFRVILQTDEYGEETIMMLKNIDIDKEIERTEGYLGDTLYGFPSSGSAFCLQPGCYEFKIFDKEDDGICCNYGNGYYKGFVEDTQIFEGAQFRTTMAHEFCIENQLSLTPRPTQTPSAFTSPTPTQIGGIFNEPIEETTPPPVDEPTLTPTLSIFPPLIQPTQRPVLFPQPTTQPTNTPTALPSKIASDPPSSLPTELKTSDVPLTSRPTPAMTGSPSNFMTEVPITRRPTQALTASPSDSTTEPPSSLPTELKTSDVPITSRPSPAMTGSPSDTITDPPSSLPTESKTSDVPITSRPSPAVTESPSDTVTEPPSNVPTEFPPDIPTDPPTNEPTNKPTLPTECLDDPEFKWKRKKKRSCKWIKRRKITKRICKSKAFKTSKKRVWNYCRKTCGKLGLGPGKVCYKNKKESGDSTIVL
ncbi:unnamed protein product [Pseudo-nitzschia multistriata]|uniref:Peptidase M11 gametolysin domain-containing protein n=1 Tax=Pseudo-nitzschia multistriata TaxID=183589 RepID=A0A448ZMU6_9STRA|nr:unnamed protein product [Pseudo-nitzschia multistriata]